VPFVTTTRPVPSSRDWRPFAAVTWLVVFLAVYFSQPLPNNGNIIRWELWPALPFAVLDAIDPPQEPGSPPRGWAYFGKRWTLIGTAFTLYAGAFGAGMLLIACIPTAGWHGSEEQFFVLLLGLAVESLLILLLGLAGALSATLLHTCIFALALLGIFVYGHRVSRGTAAGLRRDGELGVRHALQWTILLMMLPFLLGMLFGSLSPSTDFDVNEYHLGGPKEWFLAGRITFLEHNIYTSFPFLTEMLLLGGMVVHGDWFEGALAGQLVLMLFAPITALGVYCIGRRWFSPLAGSIGALVYLSTPWVFRMSIIAYAEGGLTAYTGGAIVAGLLAIQRIRERPESPTAADLVPRDAWPLILLTGLCAGGAMASKYTGLVMAVAPWAGILTLLAFLRGQRMAATLDPKSLPTAWRLRPVMFTAMVYFAGVFALVGPWLVKNLVETGNPVYPLGYSVFGGRDLDDELAAKWRRGHARPSAGSVTGEARDLFVKVFDVAAVNDWTSPLVFAFAPLAFLWPGDRRRVFTLWGLTAWLFLCWWLFTHHLDRFWLPLLPAACALAGIGAAAVCHGCVSRAGASHAVNPRTADTAVAHTLRVGCYAVVVTLAVGWIYSLGFCSTGLVGYNAGLTDLNYARDFAARITGPEIAWINAAIDEGTLPADTKLLCVGEAELFHARFPYVYNTVFDRSILEEWCGEPGNRPAGERRLRPADEIRQTFAAHGITHVFVNWAEIVRYRQSYGYTDFAHPSRFTALREMDVLGEPLRLPDGLGLREFDNLSPGEQQLIQEWAPELIVPCGEGLCTISGQVFPVNSE
jgi:hypothetical protein